MLPAHFRLLTPTFSRSARVWQCRTSHSIASSGSKSPTVNNTAGAEDSTVLTQGPPEPRVVEGNKVVYPPEEERYVPPSQKDYEYTHEGFNSKLWGYSLGALALGVVIHRFDRYLTDDGKLPHPLTVLIEKYMWKEEDSYRMLEHMLEREKKRVQERTQASEDRVLYRAGYREPPVVRRDSLMTSSTHYGDLQASNNNGDSTTSA
ncbi:hypothetical protein IWQ62_000195 [Dispira parvispora]|uniref:Uncharacterized protein n=1 Tax=Dispira parvispora TaxID=1520584 RepID=A0A9W8B183_9FUNG|nr:hypothetical protein IWQ62_000195 [Dispira parvispora]